MLPGIKKRGVNFVDLVLYLAIMLKHFRLMVLLMCLALSFGLFYYVYARPVYYARALIRFTSLERPVDDVKTFRDVSELDLLARITAPHIVQRTARRLGLEDNLRIINSKYIKLLRARFNSERNIELDIYSYSSSLVRVWGEAMLQEYLRDRDEKRDALRANVIQTYTNEMKQISEKLEELIRSRYNMVSSNQQMEIMLKLAHLRELPQQIVEVTERISLLEQIRKGLDDPNPDPAVKLALLCSLLRKSTLKTGDVVSTPDLGPLSPVPGPRPNTVVVVPDMAAPPQEKRWEELARQREKLKGQQAELSRKFLPAHPRMQEVNKKLEEIEKEIESDLATARRSYEIEYVSLTNKLAEMKKQLPELQKALEESDRIKQGVALATAGNIGYDKMYEEMAKRISQLNFGSEKERMVFQFMGNLELRDVVPVSPNRMKLLLFSFLAGLALAIGVPFLLEFLDHTVSNVEEVEHMHRLRGLGIVPKLEPSQLPGYPMMDQKAPPDRHLVENFRVIRTNLLSMGATVRDPQAIVVASAMPEEGKTVVSYYLAASFAQMGEKTLLIDADLRRGRLHRLFNYRSAPGLSNILSESLNWRDIVRSTEKPNLFVLTCGKHSSSATELIGTSAFSELLAELRKEFKRIIIDTPPVLGLSEASMMQRIVDGVVLVIWSGRTPQRYVKSAIEILQANHAHFYGFVLNRLDLSVTSNYYNYYNYYYYSYYYYKSYKSGEKQPAALPPSAPPSAPAEPPATPVT